MAIQYLHNLPWSKWTREERFYCSILYSYAQNNPKQFMNFLIEKRVLNIDLEGEWDIGYEVCFYRDYLWQIGDSARSNGLPIKRTFDLCVFGEKSMTIIESKVCEPFDAKQNETFEKDKTRINDLPGLKEITVNVVALASSKYFENAEVYGRDGTLDMFDGHFTWADCEEQYKEPLFKQADEMYKGIKRLL